MENKPSEFRIAPPDLKDEAQKLAPIAISGDNDVYVVWWSNKQEIMK